MRILVAVDGSAHSDLAVNAVAARTWPAGSLVRVLTVVQLVRPPGGVFDAVPTLEAVQGGLDDADELAARAEQTLARPGLRVNRLVRTGDAGYGIVEEAGAWSADLVMVGSHGRTGLQRLFMGSVAEYVVRHAACSVEVVRATAALPAAPGHPDTTGA